MYLYPEECIMLFTEHKTGTYTITSKQPETHMVNLSINGLDGLPWAIDREVTIP